MVEFVEGWRIVHTLGEGAYGEVKLLLNQSSGGAVAMKVIDLRRHPNAKTAVGKEVMIHSMLVNPNVIRYYGNRQDSNYIYIFLEYAEGGELFDRIDPDVGMPVYYAQRYFLQLMAGVDYFHKKGIAHRDLKPENLLLDSHNNLKISDFGLATIFKVNGTERAMTTKCGTIPYVAPEVFTGQYHAEPADIWSCGVILVAMLSGALPWDRATKECSAYAQFAKGHYSRIKPWNNIDALAICLIRSMLTHRPDKRANIPTILSHEWCNMKFPHIGTAGDPFSIFEQQEHYCRQKDAPYSQPQKLSYYNEAIRYNPDVSRLHFFSQPTQINNLLLAIPLQTSQQAAVTPEDSISNLIYRMTRFFVSLNLNKTLDRLIRVLENLEYMMKSITDNVVTVTTIDNTRSALIFKISLYAMNNKTLLDFRLSKGCGIEFKRRFIIFRHEFLDIIVRD